MRLPRDLEQVQVQVRVLLTAIRSQVIGTGTAAPFSKSAEQVLLATFDSLDDRIPVLLRQQFLSLIFLDCAQLDSKQHVA
jgi:hypothetical protein